MKGKIVKAEELNKTLERWQETSYFPRYINETITVKGGEETEVLGGTANHETLKPLPRGRNNMKRLTKTEAVHV